VIKGDEEFRGEGDQIIRICKDKDLKRSRLGPSMTETGSLLANFPRD
jgi:hypothetical protein